MPNFFTSLFGRKRENTANEQQGNNRKQFEIFKYDGLRAQRMGRPHYAVQCFTEALAIEEDFETMGYLAQLYLQLAEPEKARQLLERMTALEPHLPDTFLQLAHVCYTLEDYTAMEAAARQAIALEEGNAMAHYLLGKSCQGQTDDLMSIAHLTKAIQLQEEFTEARLLRAEALLRMRQYTEAMEDIEAVLARNSEEEAALLLRGRLKEATGETEEAEANYRRVTEVNPFNEPAYLCLSQLLMQHKRIDEAIALLNEAIDLNPSFVQAYKERGRAKLLNGDKEGSVEDMKRALELDPKEEALLNGQFKTQKASSTGLPGIF